MRFTKTQLLACTLAVAAATAATRRLVEKDGTDLSVVSEDTVNIPGPSGLEGKKAQERAVKRPVELEEPVSFSYTAESTPIAQAVPTAVPSLDAAAAQPVRSSHLPVPDLFAQALAKATAAEVPNLFALALSKATSAEAPELFAQALSKITSVEVPAITRAMEEKISSMTAPVMEAVIQAATKYKWYEKFKAEGGTRLYWILRIAKSRAEKGEDVSQLERSFYKSLAEWMEEDEE